jgi:dCTP deaminase
MLSDSAITASIAAGNLTIAPWDDELLQPASVDLRLGRGFRFFRYAAGAYIDPSVKQDLTELFTAEPDDPAEPEDCHFLLRPGEFALAHTYESVKFGAQLAGRVEGKSSLGRLGLICHSTAGFIDPGFNGQITLELANMNRLPILLWPGMRIAQLCVFHVTGQVDKVYGAAGSKYNHQVGPTPSRSWQNWKVWPV